MYTEATEKSVQLLQEHYCANTSSSLSKNTESFDLVLLSPTQKGLASFN